MAITTAIIIHLSIVHAIFPRKPRITKITAIISRRINRLIIIPNAPYTSCIADYKSKHLGDENYLTSL
jgi:hypothetical protein